MPNLDIKKALIDEIYDSLNRAEKESEGRDLLDYYQFSVEIGGYYESLRFLEMFFPEDYLPISIEAEKRKREVFDKAAPLIYRFRKAEILQKIQEIESSDESAKIAALGDTEKFYNKIVARIDNLREKYSDIEEEEKNAK